MTQKEKTEAAPRLYDLTSLQREANVVLGYTAQQTLDYTQSLYEKKLCTYLGEEDKELREFTDSCLEKLRAMSDEEYRGMELDSVLDGEEE